MKLPTCHTINLVMKQRAIFMVASTKDGSERKLAEDIHEMTLLEFAILRNKFIYYEHPFNKNNKPIKGISDHEYDALENRYKELYNEYRDLLPKDVVNVTGIVGWSSDYRNARFAMMQVYVNAMDERTYELYTKLAKEQQDYDLTASRFEENK